MKRISKPLQHNMATPIIRTTKLLQPLWANPDHYWSVINTYDRHSKYHETLAKWTDEEFDSYVVNILSKRLEDNLSDHPLCVLGVGSGQGYQETLQLKKLKTKFPKISATVVEPNTQKISEYQEAVHSKSSDFTGIEYEWRNQTCQEYVKSTGTKKKYHFITIMHAIYYLDETEAAVTALYEMLEPGGILFILLNREHQGHIPVRFPDQYTVVLNDGSPKRLPREITTSECVIDVLIKKHIAFTQYNYTETTDVTACFNQEDTKVGNLLLDYMTLSTNFRESVPKEIFDMVIQILKNNARVKKSDEGDDRFYVDNPVDIIVISNN